MTDATIQALNGLRDLHMLKWYVIPLLSIVFYIYTKEIKLARESGDWNAVLCGSTILGVDFWNETWNGWVMHFTQRSAFWTTPGDTALRTLVGWNIEIIFMFAILGIIYYHTLSEGAREKVLGIPEMWFWAVVYSAVCVFVECLLNLGGHLVWEYSFWNLSLQGIPLIFLVGYFQFFCACIWVITRPNLKAKVGLVVFFYTVPILMNILAFGFLGWNY